MEDGNASLKGNGNNSPKISQLESELEVIKQQARAEYQNKRTQSPLREKTINSLSSVERSNNPERASDSTLRPTYVEEEHLNKATRLMSPRQVSQGANQHQTKSPIDSILWIGLGFLFISLIAAGFYLFLNMPH